VKHRYDLPFGANLRADGTVAFAIWAPGRETGTLKLFREGGDLCLPMTRSSDGWFRIETDQAAAGSLYAYDFGDGIDYPDPASRRQPQGVHGPSEVIDPIAYDWTDTEWQGRPWREAIIYELHIGTFSATGDYAGIEAKLDHLCDLGVTVIELMPIAAFPGDRGWGYDGAYVYAPQVSYGPPDMLKHLVDAAHARGLMVFLDVVYNHFGPEGTYIGAYAPAFFTARHKTPWGEGINFDQDGSAPVRSFFLHNALYWLEEYRFDGLRCDAVHTIADDSAVHIFEEIAVEVETLARRQNRHIHIVDENEHNVARLLERDEMGRPKRFTAQWNDDFHHCMHVILTGESDAYYVDYAPHAHELLGKCLSEGFAYQGEPSAFRSGKRRGDKSDNIPMSAFVNFLQNHDQVGNRPFGERLMSLTDATRMHAGAAVLLLCPSPPMIFMGEEWASTQPFPYFCDFGPELSQRVREGRIADFAVGDKFADPKAVEAIPDPTDPATLEMAKLDWDHLDHPACNSCLAFWKNLLKTRTANIVPLLDRLADPHGTAMVDGCTIVARWDIQGEGALIMRANLGDDPANIVGKPSDSTLIYTTHPDHADPRILPGWCVTVELEL
jgi:malto-oligosyltrehalose trehalohydrolase